MITPEEVWKLEECLHRLSDHHNKVSVNFKDAYPSRPYETTLRSFVQALTKQTSKIAVIEADGQVIGFCKIDLSESNGKLDHLIVLDEYRGKGYGERLMDWAMKTFNEFHVKHIEIKVIAGNKALHLYEKYGFKISAHIGPMSRFSAS